MERQWTPRNTTIEGPHWKCPSSPKPTPPNQQRERAEASIGSDHQNPSRTARKQRPPPELTCARRTVPAAKHTKPAAGAGRSKHWKRSPKTPRAQRESNTLPRAYLRAQARSRGPSPRHMPKKFHVSSESRVPQRRSHQAHDLPAVKQDPPRCPPWQHPSLQNRGLIQPTDRGLRSIWQYKNTRSPKPDDPSIGRPFNRAHFGGRRQRIPPRAHCTNHRLRVPGGQCWRRRTPHPFSLRGVPVGAAHHLVWFTRRIRSRPSYSASREHDPPP